MTSNRDDPDVQTAIRMLEAMKSNLERSEKNIKVSFEITFTNRQTGAKEVVEVP